MIGWNAESPHFDVLYYYFCNNPTNKWLVGTMQTWNFTNWKSQALGQRTPKDTTDNCKHLWSSTCRNLFSDISVPNIPVSIVVDDQTPTRPCVVYPIEKPLGMMSGQEIFQTKLNGLASVVIRGVKSDSWTESKYLDANIQCLDYIRSTLSTTIRRQIDYDETTVKIVLDSLEKSYDKISKAKKASLLEELLAINKTFRWSI